MVDGVCVQARFVASSFGLACSYCFSDHNKLSACSRCHKVYYCNVTCQRKHWADHKGCCQVFADVEETLREENKPMTCGLDRLRNVQQALEMTHLFAGEGMVRMFLYGPSCSICYKSPFHFGQKSTKDWYRCKTCNFGWCCSEAHWKIYKPQHTAAVCQKYQNCVADEKFFFNHWKRDQDRFVYCPHDVYPSLVQSFPTSWDEYFRWRDKDGYVRDRHRLPPNFFRCATDYLSQICTVLYGMDRIISFEKVREFKTLHIHVIGASHYEFPAEYSWEEIMHIFPNIQEFTVTFIGPDVQDSDRCMSSVEKVEVCPDCQSQGRIRQHSFYSGMYHDYKASSYFKFPDVCVAYNTGMHEQYVDSWETTVQSLLDMNVPCVFTSFDEKEAGKDGKALHRMQANMIEEPCKNPFSSEWTVLDMEETDKFYQKNMYVMCFQGRAS